jgi:hypothetical protein
MRRKKMSNSRSMTCTCGEVIVIVEGSPVNELCKLCPLKLNSYYILFNNRSQYKGKYIEIRARNKGDAVKLFMKEYPGKYKMTIKTEEIARSIAESLDKKLYYRYSKNEIEDIYDPGDPRRKRKPRRPR